jgi:hypothetical protein
MAIRAGAMHSRRMSDLSDTQNARLRKAMKEVIGTGKRFKDPTAIARDLHRAQASISNFLNDKTGASVETAERFAKLVGVADYRTIVGPRDASEAMPEKSKVDPYPSRPASIAWAMASGYPKAVVAKVQAVVLPDGRDPGGDFWIDMLRTEKRLFEASGIQEKVGPPPGRRPARRTGSR